MRKLMISENEIVMAECQGADGRHFEGTNYTTTVYETAKDVARAYNGDEYIRIFRVPLDLFNGVKGAPEDISEEVAAAWLLIHDDINPNDDPRIPIYVEESDAWDAYCEDWAQAAADFADMRRQGVA